MARACIPSAIAGAIAGALALSSCAPPGGMQGKVRLPPGPNFVTAAELDLGKCPNRPSGESGDWRQVYAENFSFCIPADFRQVDPGLGFIAPSGGWEGPSGTIRWRSLGGEADIAYPLHEWQSTNVGNTHRFTETIGGAKARLWDDRGQDGTRLTRAVWDAQGIVLEGIGTNPYAAGLHLKIIRTVRF